MPTTLAKSPNRKRLFRLSGYALGLVGLSVAVHDTIPRTAELQGALSVIASSNPWGILLAFLLELLSLASYALTTASLLRRHGQRDKPGRGWFVTMSLAATAIGNSLPLGASVSAIYAYRRITHRGMSPSRTTVAIAGANVISMVALIVLVVPIVILSGASVKGVLSPLAIISLIGLLVLGTLGLIFNEKLSQTGVFVFTWLKSVLRVGSHEAALLANAARNRAIEIRIPIHALLRSFLYALVNWLADLGALLVSLRISGSHVGIGAVVPAYFLGALAASLPITPGGLGVVEGSLVISLVAFGGRELPVVAAVITYRLVSFWIWLPIGWAAHFVGVGADSIFRRERLLRDVE